MYVIIFSVPVQVHAEWPGDAGLRVPDDGPVRDLPDGDGFRQHEQGRGSTMERSGMGCSSQI